jgi:hypothetical protein
MTRSPAWAGIAVMLAAVCLVVAFHQVVSGAVLQGETRRKATASLAEAVWRCKALRGAGMRVDCLLQLQSSPRV